MKSFYLDRGYYDIQVFSSDIDLNNQNKANLIFSINSGNKYYFSKYKIVDQDKNLNAGNLKDIENIIKKKLKGNYSSNSIRKVKNLIENYLKKNKIEFVEFEINTSKSSVSNSIETIINFKNSKRLFVNLIDVKGNEITEETVIRRNMTFAEGDSFSKNKLDKSLDNLKSTRIFKDVKTKVDNIGEEKINLEVEVEEQPTGSVSAGVGVGSTGSTISTSINESNLFGKGININSNVNVGTQKISGRVALKSQTLNFLVIHLDMMRTLYLLITRMPDMKVKKLEILVL